MPLNLLGWTLRPVPFMEQCRARYGDRFTVDIGPPEGKWIFLTQPDEIREMFSAPADVLHPGEGARVLEPVVGSRSVLLLDGAEHLAQRKLMLPAFHGERMRALTGVMEEVAAAEVAGWRPGDAVHAARAHAGADARGDPARRVRRGRRAAARRAAHARSSSCSTSAPRRSRCCRCSAATSAG